MLLDAAHWTHNLGHFYTDLFIPLYQTLADHSLLSSWADPSAALPTSFAATVGLIGLSDRPFQHSWSQFMPYLSPDQQDISDVGSACYTTLIVGTSRELNFYGSFQPKDLSDVRRKLDTFKEWNAQVFHYLPLNILSHQPPHPPPVPNL